MGGVMVGRMVGAVVPTVVGLMVGARMMCRLRMVLWRVRWPLAVTKAKTRWAVPLPRMAVCLAPRACRRLADATTVDGLARTPECLLLGARLGSLRLLLGARLGSLHMRRRRRFVVCRAAGGVGAAVPRNPLGCWSWAPALADPGRAISDAGVAVFVAPLIGCAKLEAVARLALACCGC